MSVKLIGIEGSLPPDSVVTWGAGALLVDGEVINTITRRTLSQAAATELRHQGHLHLFERKIAIDEIHVAAGLVIVLVNATAPFGRMFLASQGKTVGLVASRNIGGWQHYVFEDRSDFDLYAKDVAQQILKDVLYSPDQRGDAAVDRHRTLVRYGLSLVPSNPDLNAVRAYLGRSNPMMAKIARSSVKGAFELRRFNKLLAALNSDNHQTYQLKYELGNATGGGFDVPVAVGTLQAVQRATKVLEGPLAEQFPYIVKFPPPRLHEMKAASAHLFFVPQITDDDLLGDRVARYLALDSLEQALNGDVELPDAKQQRVLQTSVQKIARPTEHTSLRHKPLEATALSAVNVYTPEHQEPIRSGRMDLLGVISGLREDSNAELLLPNSDRIMVSTEDDGDGNVPRGAETIQRDGSFLRKPCVLSVMREYTPGDEPSFLLREIRLLQPGQRVAVTAMPSSVLNGAFLVDLRMGVRLEAQADRLALTINSPTGTDGGVPADAVGIFDHASTGTLEGCMALMEELSAAARNYELQNADEGVRRLMPSKRAPAKPLERILTVLDARQGRATIDEILADVFNRFGVRMRVNNTRKQVRENPLLLQYAEDDTDSIQPTVEGANYFRAFRLAGGATQRVDGPAE